MSRAAAHEDVFRAIADPSRRAVLDLLRSGERSVGDLLTSFDLSQPALSQHLRVLHDAGLVRRRSVGRKGMYRIDPAPLRRVARWVARYERFWNAKLDALGRHLEGME